MDALREKLNGQRRTAKPPAGWRSVFGKATQEEIDEVQKIIDEEFSRIDPEDWK